MIRFWSALRKRSAAFRACFEPGRRQFSDRGWKAGRNAPHRYGINHKRLFKEVGQESLRLLAELFMKGIKDGDF